MKLNLLKRLKNIQSNNKGSFHVLIMSGIFFIAMNMIFFVCFERFRIDFLMDNISKVVTDATVSAAGENLHESFATIRQGNSGSYSYGGGDNTYKEIKDTSGFYNNVTRLYSNVKTSSGNITKYSDGNRIWEISDIRISIDNARHDTDTTYKVTYNIEIPQILLWKGNVIKVKDQVQFINYKDKF